MASNETKHKKKKDKKASNKVTPKKSAAVWGSFINISLITILFFWVLFPFYSWQLQIIFDQAKCVNPGETGCPLPYSKDAPPYCPGGSRGCKETMDGPDLFSQIIQFFTHTLKQIYEIITGSIWIEIDKKVSQMERVAKKGNPRQQGKRRKAAHIGGMVGGRKYAASRRGIFNDSTLADGYGAAVDMAEQALHSSIGYSAKTAKSAECCDDVLRWDKLRTQEQCSSGFSLFNVEPFKSIFPKDFGWPYTYLFNPQNTTADGKPIPNSYADTRYDPNGSATESSPKRWVGAWFAKTQQRSWSASRGIWSRILMLFYPFINEELDNIEVELRLQNFINAIEKKVEQQKKKRQDTKIVPGSASTSQPQGGGGMITSQKCNNACEIELNKIKINLEEVFKKFKAKFPYKKDGAPEGGKTNVRGKLYDVINELGLFKKGQEKAAAAAGGISSDVWEFKGQHEGGAKSEQPKHKDNQKIDNIYLDCFVAASKPPEHHRMGSGKKKSHWSGFLNPFGGDSRYWMRYIITWYLPMITMILLTVSIFTGFWFTAFGSVNRYSNFILPFFGGILMALINMFAQPLSVLLYMLVGGRSKNYDSKSCPYDSGVYQMRRNMKQYFSLNLYITLAIIVTNLGASMVASGKHAGVGAVLSMIFPIYTLIVLVLKLFHWLWNLA